MNRREEIIQQTFAAVDRLLRPASIAQVGGFRPPPALVTSWFGGQFLGLPEERWPESRGRPMAPLLQIRTDELPCCPQALAPAALLTLFVDTAELPVDTVNGDGWCIRTYATLNDLTPLSFKSALSQRHTGPGAIAVSATFSDCLQVSGVCTGTAIRTGRQVDLLRERVSLLLSELASARRNDPYVAPRSALRHFP